MNWIFTIRTIFKFLMFYVVKDSKFAQRVGEAMNKTSMNKD